jgi:predicted CoA-binding protein
MSLKTLVLGASPKTERYAYKAVQLLKQKGHQVEAVGAREAKIGNTQIKTGFPELGNIDTITLYLSPKNQRNFYDYILKIKPRRIIFNPGTENRDLINLAKENEIQTELACTLVLLSTGQYEMN